MVPKEQMGWLNIFRIFWTFGLGYHKKSDNFCLLFFLREYSATHYIIIKSLPLFIESPIHWNPLLLTYAIHLTYAVCWSGCIFFQATKDIACFSIIFFVVFMTFAQLGHLLFGSQVFIIYYWKLKYMNSTTLSR